MMAFLWKQQTDGLHLVVIIPLLFYTGKFTAANQLIDFQYTQPYCPAHVQACFYSQANFKGDPTFSEQITKSDDKDGSCKRVSLNGGILSLILNRGCIRLHKNQNCAPSNDDNVVIITSTTLGPRVFSYQHGTPEPINGVSSALWDEWSLDGNDGFQNGINLDLFVARSWVNCTKEDQDIMMNHNDEAQGSKNGAPIRRRKRTATNWSKRLRTKTVNLGSRSSTASKKIIKVAPQPAQTKKPKSINKIVNKPTGKPPRTLKLPKGRLPISAGTPAKIRSDQTITNNKDGTQLVTFKGRGPIKQVLRRQISVSGGKPVYRTERLDAVIQTHHTKAKRKNFKTNDYMFKNLNAHKDDQRGHLLASYFGAPPKKYNLAPQTSWVNKAVVPKGFKRPRKGVTWFKMEAGMRSFFRKPDGISRGPGRKMHYSVTSDFGKDLKSGRPIKFIVNYTPFIGGKVAASGPKKFSFPNTVLQKKGK